MNLQNQSIIEALEENNFSLAISTANEIEKTNPENFELKILYGDIFLKMSNFKMAHEKYEQALRLNPANPLVYVKLGITSIQLNNMQEAVNYFKAASGFEPDNNEFKGYYGWALWEYGKTLNDQNLKFEGFQQLKNAKNGGIEMDHINNALGEYYVDNATASWLVINGENGPVSYATNIEQLNEAKKEVKKASSLINPSNKESSSKYNEIVGHIKDLETKEFHGYPFVRKAGIIGGIILIIFGSAFSGIFLLILAALYHHSNMCPGYIANRKFLKGTNKDPFWVRRINEVGKFASSITVYSRSFAEVLFLSWFIGFVGLIIQYTMAIFLLPFLIIAGYISNHDLLGKIKQLSNKHALIES